MSARRPARGQHAAAVAPRIISLNLARRAGGRPSRSAAAPRPVQLGALFERERRVRGLESAPASQGESGEQEDKWRFQAEILRAECNFLRMEREVALRKLDRHRGQMEAALRSAVETLVSGRKKIDGRGGVGVAAALDEGIEGLEAMMQELWVVENGSGRRATSGPRELLRCHGRNFEKMPPPDAEPRVKDIREVSLPLAPLAPPPPQAEHGGGDDERVHGASTSSDVETLRMKMEGVAEYSRRLEAVAAGDNAGCQSGKRGNRHSRKASASSQRSWSGGSNAGTGGNVHDSCALYVHGGNGQSVAAEKHHRRHEIMAEECKLVGSGSCCDCRDIVGKIMEQVKAESEQWTEMQDMLEQVRLEMQELQSSRDTWQHRALASDISVRSLNSQIQEWKAQAQASEQQGEDLQRKISELQSKLHTFKAHFPARTTTNQGQWSDACKLENPRAKPQQHQSEECSKLKEKQVLICRVKHSPGPSVVPKRSPLQEIGNISLARKPR